MERQFDYYHVKMFQKRIEKTSKAIKAKLKIMFQS